MRQSGSASAETGGNSTMENEKEVLDFDLNKMMEEFEQAAAGVEDAAVPAAAPSEIDEIMDGEALTGDAAEAAALFSELAQDPVPVAPAAQEMPQESGTADVVFDISKEDTLEAAPVVFDIPGEDAVEAAPVVFDIPGEEAVEPAPVVFDIPEEDTAQAAPAQTEEAPVPTRRLDDVSQAEPAPANDDPTMRVAAAGNPQPEPAAAPEPEAPAVPRSVRIRELKKKIVAGPEKQYYKLNSMGVGRLHQGAILCFVLLLLCGIVITLFTMGKVPDSRMKLTIFSQVLAMLVAGLLGCYLMLDGIIDMLHLRFSLNSTLFISFLACLADAWFSLSEERVPCCGAFVLEMGLALLAKYHRRSTEMSQMDTLRKASSLTGLTKSPKFYEKYTAILRGPGDVEDFMDTYSRSSGPQVVQQVYAFIAFIASVGIAVLAWLLHGPSMAVQIFATSMMVSVPAGYFITLTRPAAILETRLHMVGSVICGWQGVKKLCGKAVFPLRDKDLFPRGSTKLNGIKFYSERVPAEVVSYTASLIFRAGGGLVPLFRNLLASRNGVEYPVTEFRDYGNGGIGGVVNNEPVLLGSLEFLQDMGVEVPKGTTVSQAIYVSINGELAAVIAITYSKMRSAAAGLVSLCSSWKLKPVLLAGDFMLTDSFIRDKFSIRGRKVILPEMDVRAELSAVKPDPEADVLALVTRDDLVSSVYAVTGAMSLRNACRVGTLINLLGGIIGIVIMLALAYLGTTELLTPARVLLYQIFWLIPGLLATEWTRVV